MATYPAQLPMQDVFTIINWVSGQEKDIDKVLAAAYELMGFAIFMVRGTGNHTQVMQEIAQMTFNPQMSAEANALLQTLLQFVLKKILESKTK